MARKPAKPAHASASLPSHSTAKRAAPETPTRQSKRTRSSVRKSYAESGTTSDEDEKDGVKGASGKRKGRQQEEDEEDDNDVEFDDEDDGNALSSAFEDPDSQDDASSSSPSDASLSDASDQKPKKRGKSKPTPKKHAGNTELWKPGAKLEPGTQVIIKKPKARGVGETPYEDATVHPNTLWFLGELRRNNERAWLKLHDPDYRAALADWTSFVEAASEKIIEADETIPELPVKDVVYRIYRDVRFSKDQTPYKTYFSAGWSRTGRKGPYAAYYVQIQPDGGSFIGGGLWQPPAPSLALLRRAITRHPSHLKRILCDPRIRRDFLGGVGEDEGIVVREFVGLRSNRESALKVCPKGYDPSNPNIALLRLRNFTLGVRVSDAQVLGEKGKAGGLLKRVVDVLGGLSAFVTYLNSVVMPDGDAESDSESSSGFGGENEEEAEEETGDDDDDDV